MSAQPIPNAALDDRLGFLGTSGSGKTYSAGTAVERLLHRKARIVIVDPLGVWWGLRLLANGKSQSPFNVVIFGGSRGDLPLTESAGELIGETAATMAESCIVDLSGLTSASQERRFMTAFLETMYRKTNGEPFHLILDEADLFAPQKPPKGAETLLNRMENIVRRGRVKGFIPWLISQRPAVVNKNVLSQVDGLIALKLTSTQDRSALDSWIEGQADKAQGKAIKDSLPTLNTGQAVVWLPGHAILKTAQFPEKETYDSSRTPKRGQSPHQGKKLKPLNIAKLKELLTTVEAEEAASNPTKLKAEAFKLRGEITKLNADLAKLQGAKANPKADKAAIDAAEKRGFEQAKKKLAAGAEREAKRIISETLLLVIADMGKALEPIAEFSRKVKERIAAARAENVKRALTATTEFTPSPAPGAPAKMLPARREVGPVPARPARNPSPAASGDGTLTKTQQAILDSIAWIEKMGLQAPSKSMVAFLADSSPKSSTFEKYVSQLKSGGYLETGSGFRLTDMGRNAANQVEAALDHQAMMNAISGKLTPGQLSIVRGAVGVYPQAIGKDDLAGAAGMSPTSSTFEKYLSQVKSLGLVDQPLPKTYVAANLLFPEAA